MMSLLFDTKKVCLFCLDSRENLSNYTCPECKSNVEEDHLFIRPQLDYVDEVYYSVYYNRFIKELLHGYKFNDRSYLYRPFGDLVIGTIRRHGLDREVESIYYVPLHRRKLAKRGYNQSELMAKYIAKELSLDIGHDLKKVKATKEQHRLNRMERERNLENSFKLKNGEGVRGKTILLIDDLITTGSTMDECGRVLKEAGAEKVIGMCLASGRESTEKVYR